jgi:hypothetical protein
MTRIAWPAIITRAAEIVRSYETSVTLRQLFYRLVSTQLIPNNQGAYKRLSALTAEARRDDGFPDLIDRGREIHRYQTFADVSHSLAWLAQIYQLDRTTGQDVSLYLGVEKAGMVIQLQSWFGDLGVPVLALGGYSSQTYADNVAADANGRGRPAVLLYGGDFDPSGEDIDRDFIERTGCWDKVIRVALTAAQVAEYQLPVNPGKATDSRAPAFAERHGELMQVELDALDPGTLQFLFQATVDQYWDTHTRPCSNGNKPARNGCRPSPGTPPRKELTDGRQRPSGPPAAAQNEDHLPPWSYLTDEIARRKPDPMRCLRVGRTPGRDHHRPRAAAVHPARSHPRPPRSRHSPSPPRRPGTLALRRLPRQRDHARPRRTAARLGNRQRGRADPRSARRRARTSHPRMQRRVPSQVAASDERPPRRETLGPPRTRTRQKRARRRDARDAPPPLNPVHAGAPPGATRWGTTNPTDRRVTR